jgi:hypothetical protein
MLRNLKKGFKGKQHTEMMNSLKWLVYYQTERLGDSLPGEGDCLSKGERHVNRAAGISSHTIAVHTIVTQ